MINWYLLQKTAELHLLLRREDTRLCIINSPDKTKLTYSTPNQSSTSVFLETYSLYLMFIHLTTKSTELSAREFYSHELFKKASVKEEFKFRFLWSSELNRPWQHDVKKEKQFKKSFIALTNFLPLRKVVFLKIPEKCDLK